MVLNIHDCISHPHNRIQGIDHHHQQSQQTIHEVPRGTNCTRTPPGVSSWVPILDTFLASNATVVLMSVNAVHFPRQLRGPGRKQEPLSWLAQD
jgi:hypothetical protein